MIELNLVFSSIFDSETVGREAMSLIEKAKNKDPDAFDRLMRTQLQKMYRIAISMLQNEEDAADAIQETVLK